MPDDVLFEVPTPIGARVRATRVDHDCVVGKTPGRDGFIVTAPTA